MKILFLDIDGVLNTTQGVMFWAAQRESNEGVKHPILEDWNASLSEYEAADFDPITISNLIELLDRVPDLRIVISSTWRLSGGVDLMKDVFSPWPVISQRIYDITPAFKYAPRHEEISAWLKEHEIHGKKEDQISKFMIIDDDEDAEIPENPLTFVKTNANVGLDWETMLQLQKGLK